MNVDEKTGLHAEVNGQTYYFCSEHCRKKFLAQSAEKAKDPVCGMDVDKKTGLHAEVNGQTYYFCSEHCRKKFLYPAAKSAQPAAKSGYTCPMHPEIESNTPGDCPKCGMSLEILNAAAGAGKKTIYTCPMHPEIENDGPGDCPKCGMPLEPKQVSAGTEDNRELKSLTFKFWIGLVLTLPVFILAMGRMLPALSLNRLVPYGVAKWIELMLTTPVVFWAGGIFFKRAWNSIINRSPNMFTLITMGVSAAYGYSALAVLVPEIFPVYLKHNGELGLYF